MIARMVLVAAAVAVLAACGVDGPPVAPKPAAAPRTSGITLSGDARVGVLARL